MKKESTKNEKIFHTEKIEKIKDMSPKVVTALKSETSSFVIGLIFVMLGVYMLLAFISFFFSGGSDQSLLSHTNPGELLHTGNKIQNDAGPRGAQIAQFFINDCFGIPAFIITIFLIISGLNLMKAYKFNLKKWFLASFVAMIWASVTLGFLFDGVFADTFIYPGGMHGYNISRWICSQIGSPGLVLVLLAIAIIYGIVVRKTTTMNVTRKILHPGFLKRKQKEEEPVEATESEPAEATHEEPADEPAEETPQPEEIEEEEVAEEETEPEKTVAEAAPEEDLDASFDALVRQHQALQSQEEEKKSHDSDDKPFEVEMHVTEKADAHHHDDEPEEDDEAMSAEPSFEIDDKRSEEDEKYRGKMDQPYNPRLDLEHYKFPTLDLLNAYDDKNEPSIDMEEQNANKDRIIQVLRSFGIEISSIKASVGPTITLYEITPAEGVRISKIRNLEDDIALSLSALGIRIIAPIPGKGTIGIEVPNANPHIVPMSSVLASKKFQETKFELPVALGKTITNEVFMVDLAKAPHMLVAGATGQGKSVGLNAIVTSLLYKKHPSELKFVIIDPKKVEFAIYAPIERHYLAKLPDGDDAIITDVTKVVQTLNSLCVEMDTRYDLLRKAGCRNIREYNAKFINRQLNPENGHRFMPYIVIIIDEFGDLIMTAGKEVELPICRIAQLARAVGLHAIIATQRPTTNIITGTIKANFPARVAFRVASMMDSRTILDRTGAQQLIGKGDMLYLQGNDPVRVQCAFVDTPEVERIANFIGNQQGYPTAFMLPEYVDPNAEAKGTVEVDMNRLDPMFEEAARLIIYHQQGSTSLIQRKFSIGYARAGRIMDQLERAGIVGPTNGSKAREVLCVDENDLEMKLQNLNS